MIDLDQAEINKPEIAQALRDLEVDGKVTPERVFEAAKSANNPLHSFFEWDKDTGWRAHNLNIARHLIATVRYKIEVSDHGIVRAPVYVRDPAAAHSSQGYVALRSVVARGPDAHTIIATEMESCLSHLSRAMAIGVALGFSDPLGKLIADVSAFKQEIDKQIEERKAA